jgi:hypothetical protein
MFESLACTEIIIDARSQFLDLRTKVLTICMEGIKGRFGGLESRSELLRV